MKIAVGLCLSACILVGCPSKKVEVEAGPAPKAELEPSDAGLAAWPGWPLAPDQALTPGVVCQALFAPSEDLHDACARAQDPTASIRDMMRDTLADCSRRLERSIINDRAAIAPEIGQRCVAQNLELRRSGRAATEGTDWGHACDGVMVGKQPAGAACREEWECAAGLACHRYTKSTAGKCITPAALNEGCTPAIDLHFAGITSCTPETYCDLDKCHPRLAEGAVCTAESCADGLFCSRSTHTCLRALAKVDAACTRHEDCAVGLYCAVKKCALQHPAGAKCLDSIECKGDCRGGRCLARCGSG